MWKSFFLLMISIPFSLIAFSIAWLVKDLKIGVIIGMSVLGLFGLISVINILTLKKLSKADIFLPIPMAIVWSIILTPLSLGANLFSAPMVIGASIIFSASLYKIRINNASKNWAIVPAITFIYEMIPVNIPGPFDDVFAFVGSAIITSIQFLILQNNPVEVHQEPDKTKNILITDSDNQ